MSTSSYRMPASMPAVTMKCIELYPESLSLANQADALPLHLLLSNPVSFIEEALMMIEKHEDMKESPRF
jgi:hypothetical protein